METFPGDGESWPAGVAARGGVRVEKVPTIKDVARVAQVGIATVSRAMNGHVSVTPETRERVLEAARTLGYHPNRLARSMATRTSQTLGLMIPDIRNPLFPSIARGFEDEARSAGYSVFLCDTDEDLQRETAYLDLLLENRAAGVAFAGTATPANHVKRLRDRGTPVVSVNPDHKAIGVDTVFVDHQAGAREAVQHLIQLGHRVIANVAAPQATAAGRARFAGYQEALAGAGIPFAPELVAVGNFFLPSGYDAALQILPAHPEVTAVFAAADLMGLGVMRAVRELKRSVPEDIAVIGFGDLDECVLADPGLSSIAVGPYNHGRILARQLVRRIQVQGQDAEHVQLPCHLVARASTMGQPARNGGVKAQPQANDGRQTIG